MLIEFVSFELFELFHTEIIVFIQNHAILILYPVTFLFVDMAM
jgi:hypothetical protein